MGGERFFPGRRFYVRAEGYYKQLSNLISYDIDNTRIVYSGQNDTEGYAYGLDVQVRGELVPGLESWFNYGFLVTDERYTVEERFFGAAEGYIPRPTDRRHNLSLFVQDYVPGSDDFRLHLRALFGTGSPFTAPTRRPRSATTARSSPGCPARARRIAFWNTAASTWARRRS